MYKYVGTFLYVYVQQNIVQPNKRRKSSHMQEKMHLEEFVLNKLDY
jgi:hypothetical protein